MWLMHDRDLQKESDTLEIQYAICRGCRGLAKGVNSFETMGKEF